MGNIFRYIVLAGALLCMLQACKKQSLETTYSSQEERIDSFIEGLSSQDPAPRIVHNGGSNRVVLTEGSGEELRQGGTVSFYYAGYIFSGSSAPTASRVERRRIRLCGACTNRTTPATGKARSR